MSALAHRFIISAPMARSVAIAALFGAAMLASPLSAARAASTALVPIPIQQVAQTTAATEVSHSQGESFDQRIGEICARMVSAEEYCQPHAAAGQAR
jgi:hypothetical protein